MPKTVILNMLNKLIHLLCVYLWPRWYGIYDALKISLELFTQASKLFSSKKKDSRFALLTT